jgi:hypothetical protein
MSTRRFRILGNITDVHTIAVNRRIRELQNLKKLFGTARWRRLKGVATVQFENGHRFRAELHWYEAHGIGKR